jgi:plasmid stabilization system protein ParE
VKAHVKWRPRAVADIERLHAFLKDKDAAAAAKAASIIFKAATILEASPRVGRPLSDETKRREFAVPFGVGFYVLRYMLEADETVVVLRVWHSKEAKE